MKGNKRKNSIVKRPYSATVRKPPTVVPTSLLPGILQPQKDLDELFQESAKRDLELERSKNRLMLHAESKRSEKEREIMSNRYENALSSIQNSDKSRIRMLTEQHEITTEMLVAQFKMEISTLKEAHQSQTDRLLSQIKEQEANFQEELKIVKDNMREKLRVKEKEHWQLQQLLREELAAENQEALRVAKKESDIELEKITDLLVKKRDEQITMVIDKLYNEKQAEIDELKKAHSKEVWNLQEKLEVETTPENVQMQTSHMAVQTVIQEDEKDPQEDWQIAHQVYREEDYTQAIIPSIEQEDVIDIEELVNERVSVAVAELEEKHCLVLEELQNKVHDLIGKKDAELRQADELVKFYKGKCLELETLLKNLAK